MDEGGTVDSDHSMTWEDVYGSTTDLTSTLIGIYDSFLQPTPQNQTDHKDSATHTSTDSSKREYQTNGSKHVRERARLPGIAEVAGENSRNSIPSEEVVSNVKEDTAKNDAINRTNEAISISVSDKQNGAIHTSFTSSHSHTSVTSSFKYNKSISLSSKLNPKNVKSDLLKPLVDNSQSSFENLSPNVKRMINSSSSVSTGKSNVFHPRKPISHSHTLGRNTGRSPKISNIPLIGTTSKMTQSGVDILSTAEIYDQPRAKNGPTKPPGELTTEKELVMQCGSPVRVLPHTISNSSLSSPFNDISPKRDLLYDVPTNTQCIYDIPVSGKKNTLPLDALSLPYIDQSLEYTSTANDREFDPRLSKDISPENKSESLHSSPQTTVTGMNFGRQDSLTKGRKLNFDDAMDTKESTENSGEVEIPPVISKLSVTESFENFAQPKRLLKAGNYPEAIGSTGNLKLCSGLSDQDASRLKLEVSRPLSMSSIASSSSTSSSGVQNKGGVNSAYLASIESLDDHSDGEVMSATGSSGFVNSGLNGVSCLPGGSTAPEHDLEGSGLTQLQLLCAEIVNTEIVYVEDLRQVIEGYLQEWRSVKMFTEETLHDLFSNIEDIYEFNGTLCDALKTCGLDAIAIARCFLNNAAGFCVYATYCTAYPRTMSILAQLALDPQAARALRQRQDALGHPLPVSCYLLKPVQRILRYPLLLKNMVKHCKTAETESAFSKMTEIAQDTDDMKGRHEHRIRVQEIQSLLYGWSGPDLTTFGELCAEGTFRVFGAKAVRHAFLFDKMLLLTKHREDGILSYKSDIMCNNLMLVESISGAPLCFHVIPFNNPKGQLTLQARSARHKREWTLLLKRVILENYQAVIPNHAKQLVMELGQNKTDDDIMAEKSHNLISHTSMRKQLSAPPEYLEKRKMDRERRKTCDTNGVRAPSNKKISPKHTKVVSSASRDDICQNCHDLCSDCEVELSHSHTKNSNDDSIEIDENLCKCKKFGRCAECDRSLHFIDSGSVDHLERKQSTCTKCSSGIGGSMESCQSPDYDTSFAAKENRPYRSSENVSCACSVSDIKNDSALDDNSSFNSQSIKRTCLKCLKIKENIASTNDVSAVRNSRIKDVDVTKTDSGRSKSKEDIHRTKLPKIGTWRRKSEPGFQKNSTELLNQYDSTKSTENVEQSTCSRCRKVEFECRNCGILIGKAKDDEVDNQHSVRNSHRSNMYRTSSTHSNNESSAIEVKMYNTKNLPKKITKIKKNRAKASKVSPTKHIDSSTAKFYADLSGNMSNENILHISESTDSVNTINNSPISDKKYSEMSKVNKDLGIDDETYRRLIQKTDSFKKNELERDKCIQKLKESSENEVTEQKDVSKVDEEVSESEKPLEQIISQLLMQNREFQKILKKHQMRNTAQRRHQRLLKSHSNPEKTIPLHVKEQNHKIKPKYGRQTSAVETVNTELINFGETKRLTPTNELNSDDEHIYETLRVDTTSQTTLNSWPEIPNTVDDLEGDEKALETSTNSPHESDYVYLKFGADNTVIADDGLYATPSKIMNIQKEKDKDTKPHASIENDVMENIYDNLVDLRLRAKQETQSEVLNDTGYLTMSDHPNTPEIWISQQKEHFTTSRDRKSGSLPRSFQVVLNSKEDNDLQNKVTSPTNKTYLNKEGKVLSTDRPFTIASDKSEISYDDVEPYMNDEGNILKFNKVPASNRSSISFSYENETAADHLSRSTLDLEEEIDKCYKKNIVNNKMDLNASTNVLNDSQNLDISVSTSMEILSPDRRMEIRKENLLVHPEHKIYKPTSNLLSIKNVLNRFKNKTPNKNTSEENRDDTSIAENSGSEKNSPKSNDSSPQKKSGLNPRSYSKNLMQRFKNILGDEQPNEANTKDFDEMKRLLVNEIKVVITSPEGTSHTSTIITSANVNKMQDSLSKSVCETITSNQIADLDALSKSCDNICMTPVKNKAKFEKCRSVSVTNSTQSKILSASQQNFNRLPIYKQGSKYLGARIAQSDYVDPQTLFSGISKTDLENVNVLINKNALRPDSLLSNSSHFTSSSDGCTQNDVIIKQTNTSDISYDESFYEKSFEQIENMMDEEVFRDSAVYSDQDESETQETTPKQKNLKNTVLPTKLMKSRNLESKISKSVIQSRNLSIDKECKLENTTVFSDKIGSIRKIGSPIKNKSLKTEIKTPIDENTSRLTQNNRKTEKIKSPDNLLTNNLESCVVKKTLNDGTQKLFATEQNKSSIETMQAETRISRIITTSKIAPPVPVKPTLKTPKSIQNRNGINNINPNVQFPKKTIDAVPLHIGTENETAIAKKSNSEILNEIEVLTKPIYERLSSSNIQIKRLSFERSSLDSTSRRTNSVSSVIQTPNVENVVMKSVHERRMEIESFTKKNTNTNEVSGVISNRRSNEFTKPQNSSNVNVKMASYAKNFNEISKISVPTKIHLNSTTVKKTSIPLSHSSIKTHKYNAFNKNISNKDSDISDDVAVTNDKLTVSHVKLTDASVRSTVTNVEMTDDNVKTIDTSPELTHENVTLTDETVKLTDTSDEATNFNIGTENQVNSNSLDSKEGWVKQIVNKFQ